MKNQSRLLTEREAAEMLNFTPRFLQARRIRGDGPQFIRVSGRAVRYRLHDLEEWIERNLRSSTAEDTKPTA